jgi:hypothetical protein
MTYQIEKIDDWPAGDTRVFPFIVPDEDDPDSDRKDISGIDVTWQLKDIIDEQVVLDDSDSGVNITVTDASNGELEVQVEKGATSDLEGRYREIIQIVDATNDQSTWAGQVQIEDIS